MDTKVIELGYASDLERAISVDLQETIQAQTIAQAQRENIFLSTVRSRVKRTMYQNIYAFLNSATAQTLTDREQLLGWLSKGMSSLFPTAESACFIPNGYPIPNTFPDGRKNPNPVVIDAASGERVFFNRSPFDILTFARQHMSTLSYITDGKVEKRIAQFTIPGNRNILIIPIGEPDSELLACIYIQLLVPLAPKVLEALNDHVYGSHSREQLQSSLPTTLFYQSYRAFMRVFQVKT